MNNEIIKIISYLNILELPTDSPIDEYSVKSAYRKLSQVYHPDTANKRYADGEKFKELKIAEEYLLNNMAYVNSLIRNGFSQSNSYSTSNDAYERWKQEQEFQRRQKEEETRKKAAEEAERKRREEEEKARLEKERKLREEQARKKALQDRKEKAIKDATALSQKYKKEDYFEDDYINVNQFIMLFFNYINEEKYRSVRDIDSHYDELIENINAIKTIKQIEKAKKAKKVLIITFVSTACFIIFMLLLVNVFIPAGRYNKAVRLYSDGQFDNAEIIFEELGDYRDTNVYLYYIGSLRNFENKVQLANNNLRASDFDFICSEIQSVGGSVIYQYELDGGSIDSNSNNKNGCHNSASKDGYTFQSWSLVKRDLDTDEKELTLVLKANYTPVTYHISYDLDGGIINDIANTTNYTIETESFTLSNPEKEGYKFIGWQEEDQTTFYEEYTIDKGSVGDISLIAKYEPMKYKVSFKTNCGKILGSIVQTYDANYSLPVLTYTGHDFLGWYIDDQKVANTGKWNISTDIQLNAKWAISNYSITYYLDGGTANNKDTYTIYDSFSISNPTRKGCVFLGWTTKANDHNYTSNVKIDEGTSGNLVFYANWQFINYNISYNLDGGSASNPNIYNVKNNTISLSSPTKKGYTFLYWLDGLNNKYTNGFDSSICRDINLTAIYSVNTYNVTVPNEIYDISFYLNYDENKLYNSQKVSAGQSISYPSSTPTRENFCFRGWFDSPECTKLYDFSMPIESDIKLYAGWFNYNPYGSNNSILIDGNSSSFRIQRDTFYFFPIYDNTQFNLKFNGYPTSGSFWFTIDIYNSTTGTRFYTKNYGDYYNNRYGEADFTVDLSQYCKAGDVVCVNAMSLNGYIMISGIEKPKSTGVAISTHQEKIVTYGETFVIN
ncbi:MAG: InlB B-repeat-containing protein, partial [Bacilli bacterium]|nr:InlB B-repeat-containing protein [Bacilli bacterium]